ncbi:MAG: hypothetical protein [Microviridae sp.]|nr:MAG: hypothetical protein [Microviridae sp.]
MSIRVQSVPDGDSMIKQMSEQVVIWQLMSALDGQRSPSAETTIFDAVEFCKKNIPQDEWEQHYVLILVEQDVDGNKLFSTRPVIYVRSFINLIEANDDGKTI